MNFRLAWPLALLAGALLAACSTALPPLAPQASISTPASDVELVYDGYDEGLGLWFKDVDLVGSALDPNDGQLVGDALVWTTDLTGIQDAELATGGDVTVRLYSDDCFGVTHTVTLTATDSDGMSDSDERRIRIWTLC